MNIYDKVTAIIAEQLEVATDTLTPQTRFKEDLQADSISVVELVMAFEEEFGESISDEDAETILTIQDIVSYIELRQV